MFKRLLQTRGPYKITSNIKKTLCKYYQYHREINYIEIKPIDIDISVCLL